MRYILIIVLLFSLGTSFAQNKKKKKKKEQEHTLPICISYGVNIYQKPFNQTINSFTKLSLGNPVQVIGINLPHQRLVSTPRINFGLPAYFQLIPQKISINDSTRALLTGFNIPWEIFRTRVIKGKITKLNVGLGLVTGQLNLSEFSKKNAFFSPSISIYNSYKIRRILLGVAGNYSYDVSNPAWQKRWFKADNTTSVAFFNQSALQVYFSIGVYF